MRTLVIKLPCRDPASVTVTQLLLSLPFVLYDAQGQVAGSGRASLATFPAAQQTLLLLAAPDVVLLRAKLPPLRGRRLRQALPHALEEQLLQEAQHCHIALDPVLGADGLHTLAVVDAAWLRFLLDTFAQAGHGRLKILPVVRCLPLDNANPDRLPSRRLVLFPGVSELDADVAGERSVELLRIDTEHELQGAGWRVPLSTLPATLKALESSAQTPSTLVQHVVLPEDLAITTTETSPGGAAQPGMALAFTEITQQALTCRFDICQFEFSRRAWPTSGSLLKRCRIPAILLTTVLILNLVGVNAHWLWLRRQRDRLQQQQVELLRQTFPGAAVAPAPPLQMAQLLAAARLRAGEPAPDGWIALCDALSQSLGPIPAAAILQLDYRESQLSITFQTGTTIDPGFADRLQALGVRGEPSAVDTDQTSGQAGYNTPADSDTAQAIHWTLRSSS